MEMVLNKTNKSNFVKNSSKLTIKIMYMKIKQTYKENM